MLKRNEYTEKYAIFKNSFLPWTKEEYKVLSYIMGDSSIASEVSVDKYKTNKFIHCNAYGIFPYSDQNLDGKIPIELKDFLALVDYKQLAFFKQDKSYWTFDELLEIERLTGLKRGGPEYEHSPASNKYVYYSEYNYDFYCWLAQTDKSIETSIEFPYHLLEKLVQMKMPPNLCSEIAAPDSYKLRPIGFGLEGLMYSFKTRALPLTAFSIPTKHHGKTIVIDLLTKIIGDTKMTNKNKIGASAHLISMMNMMGGICFKPQREKFLTLKVKDGIANAKSLIYQAHSTGIKDPRQFIKDIIYAEVKRVEAAILATSFDLVNYGFNIKLAAQVAYFTNLKAELTTDSYKLDLEDTVNFYEFQKELLTYESAKARNNDICPFNWIKDHLTHDKINKPGKHKLFTSNKIRIFIKNGEIHYQTNDAEFMTDIKFNPESNQFSL